MLWVKIFLLKIKKKKQLLKVLFFAIFIGRNLDFYCTVGLYNTKYPQNKKPLNLLFKREGEVFPFKPLSACRWRVFFRSFTLLNLICAFVARIPTFRRQICLNYFLPGLGWDFFPSILTFFGLDFYEYWIISILDVSSSWDQVLDKRLLRLKYK